jgi:AcrR family transcriptional regulator
MPRAGLSRQAVTDLAVRVVAESPEGLDGLTLAAVASRAGVAAPSLYKHVDSLADLRRSVALLALQELVRRTALATVGLTGPDALRALGRAVREYARESPGLYAAAQVAPDPADRSGSALAAAGADAVAVISAVLRGFGLPEPALVDAVRATRAAVHGFVVLESHHGFGLPDDVDRSFEALLDVLVAGLSAPG